MSFPGYPEYKDSGVPWLGAVPEHWEVGQFKRLVEIQNGADYKHVEADEGYPVIGSGGAFTFASDYLYDGEAVLLGRKGTIDKPLHFKGRFWTVDTMYWAKIRPDVCGRFAFYAALTIPFTYYSTSTALPSMTQGSLNAHMVALPSEAEQAAIAAFLDRETGKIDALVAEQERLIALLKEKRQAVISHAVTKGLNPHAPMKDSGIEWLGEIPAHWEVSRLDRLMSFSSGKAHEPFIDDGGEHVYVSARFVSTQGQSAKQCTENLTPAFPGDIVMVMSDLPNGRALARAYQIPDDGKSYAVNQRVCRLSGFRGSSRYFLHQLNRNEGLLWYNDGVNQTHLSNAAYCKLALCNPPAEEQQKIADYLDEVTSAFDLLTAEAQAAITLLQERRAALISAAVTGKIDVRGLVDQQELEAA